MKIAVGQFIVAKSWQNNVKMIARLAKDAAAAKAKLLSLPECVLAVDNTDPRFMVTSAQPLTGPFVSGVREISAKTGLILSMTVNTPAGEDHAFNNHIIIKDGEIVADYKKLHLYDAFSMKESKVFKAGDALPPIITLGNFRFAPMTCYDVRFPELARRLARDGAEIFLLPAAWVRGPCKEEHWQLLVRARALENTSYVIASGECGARNIGSSLVADPMGVAIAQTGIDEGLIYTTLSRDMLEKTRTSLPSLVNTRFSLSELAI